MTPFRFVFMADCQLGCYASFSGLTAEQVTALARRDMLVRAVPKVQGFAWDADRYELAVRMANDLAPDFVVMGGDMVDDPDDPEQYAEVQRITKLLVPPMHWVPGNHDIGFDTNVPTPTSMAAYRARFGPDHYAFEHRGAVCIVVDTAVWVHAEKVPDEWDEQLAFLRSTLAAARSRGRPILVFGHHPMFTRDPDEPDDYWNIPRSRRHLLLDLLDDHGTSIFLCGHWHRNGGGRYRDLEVAVTGPVGFPLGADPSGFRIVDVTDAGVHHRYVPLTPRE